MELHLPQLICGDVRRALRREPHWPLHAAAALGQPAPIPSQYLRGF